MNKITYLAVFVIGALCTYLVYEGLPFQQKQALPQLDVNPSRYEPIASGPIVIRGATLYDGLGGVTQDTDILLESGKIKSIGEGIQVPDGTLTIDGTGKYVTPGLIDIHTHLGTATMPYSTGDVSNWDVNEATGAVKPEVRAEHAIWPQDPSFATTLAGGVTTLQVLPGSSNLFGGLGVVLKNVPAPTAQAMKFPGASFGLKMACGENPKGYGDEGKEPGSRMGNVAMQRQAWLDAQAYEQEYRAGKRQRDLGLEVLVAAMKGDVKVHVHCYRSDDMATMMDMANEFGFKIAAFHHAVEAYKISALLKENGACSAVWSDWWGYKLEALDGIQENAAFLDAAGACVAMHSDFASVGQMLPIETAKAIAAGRRAGLEISTAHALTWITSNPAKILGLEDQIGSLETGKNADVVLWSGDPFSIYSRADQVFIDGAVVYDRLDPKRRPVTDMMTGQPAAEDKP
ncbi:amidohydrolase [Kordiimonas pumila]|uniref:Amidohydrolase n=1 Tax=Kordiimonas pumila TaxID=2161677 RepID=A0ABV7D0D9_9PROT|nr:amidohydrolase [Kordiimonas pumila]